MEAFLFLGYGFWVGALVLIVLTLATADVWNHSRLTKYTLPEATKVRVEMLGLVVFCIVVWLLIMIFAGADVMADDQNWRLFTIEVSRIVLIGLLVNIGFWSLLFYRVPLPDFSHWKLKPPRF